MLFWYINFIDIEKMFDSIYCRVKKNINFRLYGFWLIYLYFGFYFLYMEEDYRNRDEE